MRSEKYEAGDEDRRNSIVSGEMHKRHEKCPSDLVYLLKKRFC